MWCSLSHRTKVESHLNEIAVASGHWYPARARRFQAGRALDCLVRSLFRHECPVADGLNTRIFVMKTRN